MSETTILEPAVVTPLDEHMGLDIARSLAKRGVTVYGIESDPQAVGRYSRACRFVPGPDPEEDPEEYVDFLERFAGELGTRPVLFPLSDLHVRVISANRHRLHRYRFVMPDHETVEALMTKDGLSQAARMSGLEAPRTLPAATAEELDQAVDSLTFPVILKPTESTYWHVPAITRLLRHGFLAGRAKVVLCRGASELRRAHGMIAPLDNRLVAQEVIPGEDGRLSYMAAYLDRESKPLAVFAGRKLRVIPTGFGSASYVRSYHDPEMRAMGLRLLESVRWQGLVGVEFKKDPRDEHYKLIEVNTRFGMWDGLGVRCGVDLPHIAYRDALGLPADPIADYRDDVIWLDWQRDLRAAVAYMRRGELTPRQWLGSLRGEKVTAIYDRDDWRPGLAATLALGRKALGRLSGRAVGGRG